MSTHNQRFLLKAHLGSNSSVFSFITKFNALSLRESLMSYLPRSFYFNLYFFLLAKNGLKKFLEIADK